MTHSHSQGPHGLGGWALPITITNQTPSPCAMFYVALRQELPEGRRRQRNRYPTAPEVTRNWAVLPCAAALLSRNGLGVRFRSGARTLSGKCRKEKREKGSGPGAKISRLRGVRPLVPERDGTSLLGEPNYWIWRRTVPPDRLIDFLTPTRPLPGG